jgi:hypothetical protein
MIITYGGDAFTVLHKQPVRSIVLRRSKTPPDPTATNAGGFFGLVRLRKNQLIQGLKGRKFWCLGVL